MNLFYVRYSFPEPKQGVHGLGEIETRRFWNEWGKEHKDIDITHCNSNGAQRGEGGEVILVAPLDKGARLMVDLMKFGWAREFNAVVGSDCIEPLSLRIEQLSSVVADSVALLKKTRSSRNKLWRRDVAEARRLLEEVLLVK